VSDQPGRQPAFERHARRVVGLARRRPAATIGVVGLALIVAAAVFAPLIAPDGPRARVGPPFEAPSISHLLGLDDGGTDMLSGLIYGARTSLLVGFGAALIATLIGGTVGVVAGYFGGVTDMLLSRVVDYFMVLPTLPLMIVVAALWSVSLAGIILIIGLVAWTWTARVLRSQVVSLRERVFVQRARSLGAGHWEILRRHILPHVAPLVIANMVLVLGAAIFFESALAFLGLGDPDAISWGNQIANAFEAAAVSEGAWWAIVPPGLCIAAVIVCCTLVGRAVEDALNPRIAVAHIGARRFRRLEDPAPPTAAEGTP
jgi:peptide/nickel transport system permease protein